MSRARRPIGHRDANEPGIVKALRSVGAYVICVDPPLADLVVGFHGVTYMLGVKAPDGPRGGTSRGRGRKNRPSDFEPDGWNGGPWHIVTTEREALEAIGLRLCPESAVNTEKGPCGCCPRDVPRGEGA